MAASFTIFRCLLAFVFLVTSWRLVLVHYPPTSPSDGAKSLVVKSLVKSQSSVDNEGESLPLYRDITFIITAHPIPSHPSLKHLDLVMDSLQRLQGLAEHLDDIPIILACDAPKRLHEKYREFQKAVTQKYPNVQIVQSPNADGICNNVKSGMAAVQTKYVLLIQHDMPFADRTLEALSAMRVMEAYPEKVKYIRFNQNENSCYHTGCDKRDCSFYREQRFDLNSFSNSSSQETDSSCMALIRSVCWSDNNHLTTVDYYNREVFPRCQSNKPMEWAMAPLMKADFHNVTGTYVYGSLDFPWQVEHEDGSETRPKNHKRRKSPKRGEGIFDENQYTQKQPLIPGTCSEPAAVHL